MCACAAGLPVPEGDGGSTKVPLGADWLSANRLELNPGSLSSCWRSLAALPTVAPSEGFVGGRLGLYAVSMETSPPNHPLIGVAMNSVNNSQRGESRAIGVADLAGTWHLHFSDLIRV